MPLIGMIITIQLFLQAYGVADIWRFLNPTSRSYSFFSPVHKTFYRIDYFFIDKKLLPMVTACECQYIVISVHALLNMKLRIPSADSNYHPWRLNPLLLSEDTFVNFIDAEIKFFLAHNQTLEAMADRRRPQAAEG